MLVLNGCKVFGGKIGLSAPSNAKIEINDTDIGSNGIAIEIRDTIRDIVMQLSREDIDNIKRSTLQDCEKETRAIIAEKFDKISKTSDKKFWVSTLLDIATLAPHVIGYIEAAKEAVKQYIIK
jgi:hypothetical protein